MNLMRAMEWLFGCPWNERAEQSIMDRKISAENARYGQLTNLVYEATLRGLASMPCKTATKSITGSMSVELADSLMVKLAALKIDRDREIERIKEEFESRRKEMSVKSKWFIPRLWHEWRSR